VGEPWWGRFEAAVGQGRRWQIGPMSLWLQHLEDEWRAAWEVGEDPYADGLVVAEDATGTDLLSKSKLKRFGLAADPDAILLAPALADRPVVVHPEHPFGVPPGESCVLYVNTPMWVQVRTGPERVPLLDMAIFRPSDSWFGPPTHDGELCYASRAFGRMRLEELPSRPHRATTAVKVVNRGKTQLPLERLKLPVDKLPLYQGEDGRLWTPRVVLERAGDDDFALVKLEKQEGVQHSARIAAPRVEGVSDRLVRAFQSLWGDRSEA
jgi:hypothetical protein